MATVTKSERRTREDWEALAKEVLPELKSGVPFSELSKRYGVKHVYPLRVAIAELGYDLKGQPLPERVRPITVKRPEAVAKQVAARREKGSPFWLLSVETGLPGNSVKKLLSEHGYEHLLGRATKNGSSN